MIPPEALQRGIANIILSPSAAALQDAKEQHDAESAAIDAALGRGLAPPEAPCDCIRLLITKCDAPRGFTPGERAAIELLNSRPLPPPPYHCRDCGRGLTCKQIESGPPLCEVCGRFSQTPTPTKCDCGAASCRHETHAQWCSTRKD